MPETRTDQPRTRHRLTVLATDTSDAVSGTGGLIFDRATSGWHIDLYLAEPGDGRPLRILGVDAYKLLPASISEQIDWPDALVVAGRLCHANNDVRGYFDAASRRHHTEVAVWGDTWPTAPAPAIGRAEHRLSIAARAFKAHALTAADMNPLVQAAELFHSGPYRCNIAAPLRQPADRR